MREVRQSAVKTLLILSAAVFLRAIAPAGYMPSSAGSGLLFELCPDGVSMELMAMLTGGAGHDHDEHHQSVGGHECAMGHMLFSAAAVDGAAHLELTPNMPVYAAVHGQSFTSASRTHYHSRGPPA